jgi:hypothetical protein
MACIIQRFAKIKNIDTCLYVFSHASKHGHGRKFPIPRQLEKKSGRMEEKRQVYTKMLGKKCNRTLFLSKCLSNDTQDQHRLLPKTKKFAT